MSSPDADGDEENIDPTDGVALVLLPDKDADDTDHFDEASCDLPPDPQKVFRKELARRMLATQAYKKKLAKEKEQLPPFDHASHRLRTSGIFSDILDSSKHGEFVEKGIFNHTVSVCKDACENRSWENEFFKRTYNHKVRSIFFNLNNPHNPGLRERLENKEIKYSQLASLSYRELHPEIYRDIDIKKEDKETAIRLNNARFKAMLGEDVGMFRCGKCKSWKTTYYSLQTRGADEPMTNFISCLKCQNRWKC